MNNDNHTIHDDMSFDDIAESISSITRNDTTPEASTAQPNEGNSQASAQGPTNEAVTQRAIQNVVENYETSRQVNDDGDYSHFSFAEGCRTAKPQAYLIYNEVLTKGLHMTYGEPASGKTFYVIDKAASIACEDIKSWHDKNIRHGQVVYFAGEASEGVKLRCKGWAIKRGIKPENVNLIIFDEVFCLDDEKDTAHTIDKTIQQIRKYAPNAVYILFDTLHAFMRGDENLAVDTNKFLKVCRTLISTFDCAVELIHHVGNAQDAKKRGRGSSAWKGAMDIETLVENIASTDTSITCRISQNKHKDGKKHKLVFNMQEVTLPGLFDDAGYAVTTLVPEIDEANTNAITTPEPQKKEKTSKTNIHHKRGVKTFKEAAIRYGRLSTNEAGDSFIDVELEEWRKVAYEIIESGNTDSAKRSAFNRAKQELVEDAEPPILTRYENEEGTFYRLSRNGENEAAFRVATFAAVKRRIEEDKLSTKTNEAGGADAGDTTQNLF